MSDTGPNLFASVEDAPEEKLPKAEDRQLEKIIESGNVEALKEFIKLRNSEQDRIAKLSFEQDFALMQQELPPIVKRKDNPGTKSKYAQLEDVQNGWNPTIKKWGFSYTWRTEPIEGKDGWTRTYMDIRKYGHTQTNFIDLPPLLPTMSGAGNQVQNDLQVVGGQASYGRRYSMIPGFGGVVEGEDSDGKIPGDYDLLDMDLREYIKSGKLPQQWIDSITRELMVDPEDRDIEKLKGYWKRARAKVLAK